MKGMPLTGGSVTAQADATGAFEARGLKAGEVTVTAIENLTRAGEPIQERGVSPDVAGEDASLEKAKEILRKGQESKPPR